jgi:hypothetical protein
MPLIYKTEGSDFLTLDLGLSTLDLQTGERKIICTVP